MVIARQRHLEGSHRDGVDQRKVGVPAANDAVRDMFTPSRPQVFVEALGLEGADEHRLPGDGAAFVLDGVTEYATVARFEVMRDQLWALSTQRREDRHENRDDGPARLTASCHPQPLLSLPFDLEHTVDIGLVGSAIIKYEAPAAGNP